MSASYALAEKKMEEVVHTINGLKAKKSLKTIYNNLTKNGVEVFVDGDYVVYIDAHYLFEWLCVQLWYEPQDFSQRKIVKEVEISR